MSTLFNTSSVIALASKLEVSATLFRFQLLACCGLAYSAELTNAGETAKAATVRKAVREAFLKGVFKSNAANNYKLLQYSFELQAKEPKLFAREYPSLAAAVDTIAATLVKRHGTFEAFRLWLYGKAKANTQSPAQRVVATLQNATKGEKPVISQHDLQSLLREVMATCLKPHHLASVAAVVASLERDYQAAKAKETPDAVARVAAMSGKSLGAKSPKPVAPVVVAKSEVDAIRKRRAVARVNGQKRRAANKARKAA